MTEAPHIIRSARCLAGLKVASALGATPWRRPKKWGRGSRAPALHKATVSTITNTTT